ncbi:MAG: Flavin-dependent thymidylate synthase [Chlamydiia bacterium]|nr:Flavin-dependent thymidylate synthase [Chlamydiia bacterium]
MKMGFEEFSESEKAVVGRYVTNVDGNVFVLRNLPEVIKGALFSRYSRSMLGLRGLLLKDFIKNDEMGFEEIAGKGQEGGDEQILAIQKAQDFYDRILDGYGDDSIGELGGAHLAIENVSMIACKAIQDARIGGSPLEKSTRYIYFDQKVNGKYRYEREKKIMGSRFAKLYESTCDRLFETYAELIPPLTEMIREGFPHDPEVSKGAYNAALRAQVLDCLRGLLPAGTLTNMGVFGNGRFFESLIARLNTEGLSELSEIGKDMYSELHKVIPSFVRRSEENHRHQVAFNRFKDNVRDGVMKVARGVPKESVATGKSSVTLIHSDSEGPRKVASSLLFAASNQSFEKIEGYVGELSLDGVDEILQAAADHRGNRRHKSPRALENAHFTFEIVADYGVYRDLQRHRMLTQDRQLLTADLGYYFPKELEGTPYEKTYREAMEFGRHAYLEIAQEFPEEAQYVVPMAYHIRWYFHINLRALQWLCELRSSPQGHPQYRLIAQQMAEAVMVAHPEFKRFFAFVDFDGYELGRLDQEIRKEAKQGAGV